ETGHTGHLRRIHRDRFARHGVSQEDEVQHGLVAEQERVIFNIDQVAYGDIKADLFHQFAPGGQFQRIHVCPAEVQFTTGETEPSPAVLFLVRTHNHQVASVAPDDDLDIDNDVGHGRSLRDVRTQTKSPEGLPGRHLSSLL